MAFNAASGLIISIMTLRTAEIAERIRAVAAAGCTGLGWRLDDFSSPGSEREIPKLLQETGVRLNEIEFFREWLGKENDPAYQANEKRLFELAQRLGARHVNVAVFTPCTLEELAAGFKKLCRRAAPYGLIVQLEFMPYTPPVDTLARAWQVVRQAGEPNGGLLVDAWHWARTPGSAGALSSVPPEMITSVQLGDVLATPLPSVTEESRHHRQVPGRGALDLHGFLRALQNHGVEAPLSVEVMSDELDELAPHEAARQVAEGVRTVLSKMGSNGATA